VQKANAALASLGQALSIHPVEALQALLAEAWGNVAFYRAQLQPFGADLLVIDRLSKAESTRGLVLLYNQERERCARLAKMCIDVGLSDRVVRLQEAQSEAIVAIVYALISGLSLDATSSLLARKIASQEIRRLASGPSTSQPLVVDAEGRTPDPIASQNGTMHSEPQVDGSERAVG